jgi:hypothetical protein
VNRRLVIATAAVLVLFGTLGFGFASATHEHSVRTEDVNAKLRQQLQKERAELRELRRLAAPILRPTPAGNKLLAKRYFRDEYPCAYKIIEGETAGTWDHTIWNYEGSGAFGLGQARPRDKMLPYAYAGLHPYENPMPQLVWMDAYADERFDGICNAAAQWTYARSW